MIRLAISALLGAHAVAHLVGFVVPWRLVSASDVPYRTTILGGLIDIGDAGARALGVVWLIVAVALGVVACGVLVRASWWPGLTVRLLGVSLTLCVIGWPDSRFGILANGLILMLIFAWTRLGWQSAQ